MGHFVDLGGVPSFRIVKGLVQVHANGVSEHALHHMIPSRSSSREVTPGFGDSQIDLDDALVSVVLPAFNEAPGLPELVRQVLHELEQSGMACELLVVDDGSRDDTQAVMHGLCRKYSTVRYLRLSRNFGKEAAITAGLEYARGDAVILMDADGQHPVNLLSQFIRHWRNGADSVIAVQVERNEPLLQRIFKTLFYKLMSASSTLELRSGAGDFRLMDRRIVDHINALPERNRFMKGLYEWVGFDSVWIEYQALERAHGRSTFGWKGLVRLGLTGITAFSVLPLRLVSVLGLLVSLSSLVYGLYLSFEHFSGHQLPGWATLAVGTMFLSGIQLLSLGAIAEYLGRVFTEVKQRPVYIVAEQVTGLQMRARETRLEPVVQNDHVAVCGESN